MLQSSSNACIWESAPSSGPINEHEPHHSGEWYLKWKITRCFLPRKACEIQEILSCVQICLGSVKELDFKTNQSFQTQAPIELMIFNLTCQLQVNGNIGQFSPSAPFKKSVTVMMTWVLIDGTLFQRVQSLRKDAISSMPTMLTMYGNTHSSEEFIQNHHKKLVVVRTGKQQEMNLGLPTRCSKAASLETTLLIRKKMF